MTAAEADVASQARPAERSSPRRDPRRDLLPYVVATVALLVYLLHGFNGYLDRDVSLYAYSAQHVVAGDPPYVSVLNRAGPLAHLLPAAGVAAGRVLGIDDLIAMRLLYCLFSVAAVALTYVVGAVLFRSRPAGLASAAAMLSFSGFIKYATYGPREKTPMVVFVLLTLLFVARRRWAPAGASVALAFLIWQPAAVAGGFVLVVPLLGLGRAERLRAFGATVVGGLIPIVVVSAYFALQGVFRHFIDAFLVINARYTISSPLSNRLVTAWNAMVGGYKLSLVVLIVGLIAILVGAVVRMRGGLRTGLADPVVVTGAGCAVATAWSIYDFNSWPDAFYLLPFAALGIGAIVAAARERFPGSQLVLRLVVGWLAVAVLGATVYSVDSRDDTLLKQRRAIAAVVKRVPEDATYMSVQAPQPLVLAPASSISQHQMFARGLARYIDDTWPGGLQGFTAWVEEEQPDVMVWELRVWRRSAVKAELDGLRELVRRDYRRVGYTPGWVTFVSDGVDVRPRDLRP